MNSRRIKYIKYVPTPFINENRDEREIQVALTLGIEVSVYAKSGKGVQYKDYGYPVIRYNHFYVANTPKSRLIRWSCLLLSYFNQARYLRRQSADIISCHDLTCLAIGWLSTIGMRHKPYLVYDSHEYEYGRNTNRSKFKRVFIKHVEGFLMRRVSFSIMVNDSIADRVQSLHHLKERPIVVRNIPNKWELDESVIREVRKSFLSVNNLPTDTFICMYHGALMRGRGVENDIRALAKTIDTVLFILGNDSGAYAEEYKRIAREYGVADRLFFHSAVPSNELWKYVGMADVGLAVPPNICESYYLSLPNKFFENIQALTPLICSKFPEFNRLVSNYGIGICVEPEDIDGIATAIMQMHNDRAFYDCCKANLIRAKEELCWEKEREALVNIYNVLLNKF